MSDEDWVGPWCSYHAVVVKDKVFIVDEIYQYRRHVFVNGEFKTEKISIEKWRELGYEYMDLSEGFLKVG